MAQTNAPEAELTTRMAKADAGGIAEAARCLGAGGLVAFPTETVYGLGADSRNSAAIARLYAAKGRPAFNPLIAHVADAAAARRLGRFDAAAEQLTAAFWPGPLTLVLPKTETCAVADLATAGLDSVAVRVPAHPVAQAILRGFGGPVVAPSANRSGHVSPTTPAHVRADLAGRIDLIVDGGATPVGVESTIVACLADGPALLRPGGVPREAIERVLQVPLAASLADAPSHDENAPRAPGMLASHYAPRTPLRLDVKDVAPGEALLAFGPALAKGAAAAVKVLNLSARGDPIEAAANLFSHLRTLDASGAGTIAVMTIPLAGLGEAINDRLRRAARCARGMKMRRDDQGAFSPACAGEKKTAFTLRRVIAPTALSAAALLLCAAAARAEVQKFLNPCGQKLCPYYQIVLTPPDGWALDAKATKDNKIQIVVPKGQSFATAEPLIYVQVFYHQDKQQALADFARTSNARWIAANAKSKITELPAVERANGKPAFLRFAFENPGKAEQAFEVGAFGIDTDKDGNEFVLDVVMSGASKEALDGANDAYLAFLKAH